MDNKRLIEVDMAVDGEEEILNAIEPIIEDEKIEKQQEVRKLLGGLIYYFASLAHDPIRIVIFFLHLNGYSSYEIALTIKRPENVVKLLKKEMISSCHPISYMLSKRFPKASHLKAKIKEKKAYALKHKMWKGKEGE